ncbi:monoheme cytochrome C [Galbibacter sp. EGI 63066]|uniref:monoheme cytochrome C n=1 Tax=Galbibacter sp. EGI 63066 TaxID=2993559 RepID=UPI002249279A|nr:monoheme cytochrome C [Galbibacter sp. EGI 63066]MCX2680099.1 monoheme cytochrome C [Galbibacter sp. EGI 63066]
MKNEEHFIEQVKVIYRSLLWFCIVCFGLGFLILLIHFNPDLIKEEPTITAIEEEVSSDITETIRDSIHADTGLIKADGLTEVINNCTNCHSAKIIIQNRMTRENWLMSIRWMQETQNLWDLGENENIILDYLATHYAPKEKGRRENLIVEEWYVLEKGQ